MTREEQRRKLAERMLAAFEDSRPGPTAIHWMLAALDAIGAAGFCVVAPNATEEMIIASGVRPFIADTFRRMARAGNLANTPEAMEKKEPK